MNILFVCFVRTYRPRPYFVINSQGDFSNPCDILLVTPIYEIFWSFSKKIFVDFWFHENNYDIFIFLGSLPGKIVLIMKVKFKLYFKKKLFWNMIRKTTDHDKSSNVLWSSELPAQKRQILWKFLRICQLFKVLRTSPQYQRPNSITFI